MGLGGGGNSTSSILQSSGCFLSNLTINVTATSPAQLLWEDGSIREREGSFYGSTVTRTGETEHDPKAHDGICFPCSSRAPPPHPHIILSHPNRSGDPEPWRCRRTDGKKWRCSRDVAAHQKYCERHSHKNRPRSRKPVELPAASTTADYLLDPAKTTATVASTATRRSLASQPQQPPVVDSRQALSSHFSTPYDQDPLSGFPSAFASPQPFDHPRCLDWFMKGETVPKSNSIQEWHHQHQNDVSAGSKSDAAVSCKNKSSCSNIDPFQLKQSSHYSTPQNSSLFLMESAMDPGRGQQTRLFIDAWSNVDEDSGNRAMSGYSPSSGKNDLSASSLTLTMCGGEGDDYSNRMGEKPCWMNVSVRYQTSPRGCSSVTTTTTTSGQNSSKDEVQDEFNFIG